MTQPKNPEVGVLDQDRQNRIMMQMGSKALLNALTRHHPRIVRALQDKHGIVLTEDNRCVSS